MGSYIVANALKITDALNRLSILNFISCLGQAIEQLLSSQEAKKFSKMQENTHVKDPG